MNLPIEKLTPEAFAPFGAVVDQPNRATDASGAGWKWWAGVTKLAGGDRPYQIGYLDLQPAPLRFDWAERHMHTDEMLVPMNGDCLVYVGPPDYPDEPARLPLLDRFRVFKVRRGQAVLMKPGIWHGAPLAIDQPLNVLVVLLDKTADLDLHVGHFEKTPVDIVR